jgi:superfamily II DNA or RNA helicase
VLWLVPRLSLCEQVADAFVTGFGARPSRRLEVVDGQDPLFAPSLPNTPQTVGCLTTYQSVAHKGNWKRFRDACAAWRTLVIFDEVQFLNDDLDRGWHSKIAAVKDAAAFVLAMSGTLWRTDNRVIPFVEHERRSDGKLYPLSDISYGLREAVSERALLPTEWRNRPGTVTYLHDGVTQTHELLDDGDDEESRKVRAFLSCEASVSRLLDDMVDDWRDWCKRTYQSRMIVMADDTREARRWRDHLQTRHQVACVLATSREEAADRKLRHFRERRQGQCLVTVAMAYVGFDCPDLTHLAYLSATRAPSWMLQSAARVSRHDQNAPVDYDRQHAFVYAPDDARIRTFFDWLRTETEIGINDRSRHEGKGGGNVLPAVPMPDDFEPLAADPSDRSIESLHRRLSPEVVARLDAFARTCPAAADLPRSKLYEILASAGVDMGAAQAAGGAP